MKENHLPSRRILFVENDTTEREIIESALEEFAATLVIATNGKQALETLEGKNIDGIIVPHWYGNLSLGKDLVEQIRAKEEFKDIPIIVCTGDASDQQVVKRVQELGGTVLAKPYDIQDLIAAVNTALANKTVST